ncbi:MAG: 1-acyl-sn-glycerol-3-phosphate acyltransferase [Bacteroidales bacterium]
MRYSEKEFDDIRPFNDAEFKRELDILLKDKAVRNSVNYFFNEPSEQEIIMTLLGGLRSVDEFQSKVIALILEKIIDTTSDGFTDDGFQNIENDKQCLYLSNHRDIVLDTGFLNLLLHRHNLSFTRTAIGNNLLIYKWIESVVKLNRSFVVKRDLPIRQQLEASTHLSRYIRYSLVDTNTPVWLAQREGRTKNGCDKTQPSVLKMLSLSNSTGSFTEGFRELNIMPLSISYEVEPCLTAKIDENILRDRGEFEKAKEHDLAAMFNGIDQYKGRIHFGCGKPLEIKDEDFKGLNNKDALAKLACLIDKQIYSNFKLFPFHYIAYDRMSSQSASRDKYTDEDIKNFDMLLSENIDKLSAHNPDEVVAKFIAIYSNPINNLLENN